MLETSFLLSFIGFFIVFCIVFLEFQRKSENSLLLHAKANLNLAQCQKMLQDVLAIIKDQIKRCKGQAVVDLRCALQCADQEQVASKGMSRHGA